MRQGCICLIIIGISLVSDKPEIIGTLYSTGMFKADGLERVPHENPVANVFEKKAKASIAVLKKLF